MLSHFSCVQFFATPWTIAYQAPLSMGFSRQEYWSGLPYPPPRDLSSSGIEPGSPALHEGFPCVSSGKESKSPWRRERLPTLACWPGEFHGLYSPWGHKESDMTERFSLSLSWGSKRKRAEVLCKIQT